MLYKIKFISEEVDGFFREFEIDSDSTFLDLNKAVLGYCNYPDDQMTSFYVCNREWERGQQITREDMSYPGDEENDLYLMEKTPLSDFIDDKGQRFEFVFDPFSERSFYLQVKEIIPGQHLDAPELLRSAGDAPEQLAQLDVDPVPTPVKGAKAGAEPVDEEEDEDDLFYGDSGFNSDDFDPEGFEFTEGQPY